MPLPVLADHFRTITEFSNVPAGVPFTVSMDFYVDPSVAGAGSDQAVGEGLLSAWNQFFGATFGAETIADQIHQDVGIENITVYDLTANKAPYQTGPTPAQGTANISPLPPDLAIVFSKRTATRGRAGRGRFYLAGWTNDMVTPDGNVNGPGTLATAANNELLNFGLVGLGDAVAQMVVISQAANPSGTPYEVTNITVDNHWDVQRRRGVR